MKINPKINPRRRNKNLMNDVRVDRRRSTRSVVGLERRDEQINPKKNPRRRNKNLMIDVRVDRRRSTRSVVDLERRDEKN